MIVKKYLPLFVFISLFFFLGCSKASDKEKKTLQKSSPDFALVKYNGVIEDIFFHPLLIDSETAFRRGKHFAFAYNWFITVGEFQKIIAELYSRDYVLIDIHEIYSNVISGDATNRLKKDLYLPRGKKPLILSVDDLNYYKFQREIGSVSRLVLDRSSNIADETDLTNGGKLTTDSNEIIPIMENFIKLHPDFSFHGARGIIALTGYQGILGYRTHRINAPDYEEQKEQASRVVAKLKSLGWIFASHGWAHPDCIKMPDDRLQKDIDLWDKYVRPVVGDTEIFVYPYGNVLNRKNPKFQMLLNAGFREFFGVCPTPSVQYHSSYVYFDRIAIDGQFLRGEVSGSKSSPLFDIRQVADVKSRGRMKRHTGLTVIQSVPSPVN